jgi:hypothetical protein
MIEWKMFEAVGTPTQLNGHLKHLSLTLFLRKGNKDTKHIH